jgi:hypothetical protein
VDNSRVAGHADRQPIGCLSECLGGLTTREYARPNPAASYNMGITPRHRNQGPRVAANPQVSTLLGPRSAINCSSRSPAAMIADAVIIVTHLTAAFRCDEVTVRLKGGRWPRIRSARGRQHRQARRSQCGQPVRLRGITLTPSPQSEPVSSPWHCSRFSCSSCCPDLPPSGIRTSTRSIRSCGARCLGAGLIKSDRRVADAARTTRHTITNDHRRKECRG